MILTLPTVVFVELVFTFIFAFLIVRDILSTYRELNALPDLQLNSVFLTTTAQSLELRYLILSTRREKWSKIVGPLIIGGLLFYCNFSNVTPILASVLLGYSLKGVCVLFLWRELSRTYTRLIQRW